MLLIQNQSSTFLSYKLETDPVQAVLDYRVVPVLTLDSVTEARAVAEALLAGGLPLMEITFRTAAAADCIRAIREMYPQITVGAGTILTPDQLREARAAGAQFGVAPGLNEDIMRLAQEQGWPFLPGVMTPSEVERALALGCRLLKFFPADVAGGVKMLRALDGPYRTTGVKFVPLGGIQAGNMAEYLALPNVAAVGGSWLADRNAIAAGDWAGITKRAREAVEIVRSLDRR